MVLGITPMSNQPEEKIDKWVKVGQGLERQYITFLVIFAYVFIGPSLAYLGRWEEFKLWLASIIGSASTVAAFFYKAKTE